MQQIADFNLSVAKLGSAGLQNLGGTGNGFSPADATTVIADAATLNTVAAVYFGTATQGTLFNFNDALAPLWAGQ